MGLHRQVPPRCASTPSTVPTETNHPVRPLKRQRCKTCIWETLANVQAATKTTLILSWVSSVSSCTYTYMCICCTMCVLLFFTLDAGLLARSHLGTGFSWFPCVDKQMLRWFPRFQVATTCFSCSLPDLNLLVTNFMFCIHVK